MSSPSSPIGSGNPGKRLPSRLIGRYSAVLAELSRRTGTPLSSLIVSFAVLHEASAVVSLFGLFVVARAGGVGERVVASIKGAPGGERADREGVEEGWVQRKGRQWVEEGEKWAEKLGRRYGFFGFEKGSRPGEGTTTGALSGRVAGDVANIILAYAVTKVGWRRPGLVRHTRARCIT